MSALRDPAFGSGPAYAVGVEEELLLVDADGALANARSQVLSRVASPGRGEVTGEVHACEIELITDVCSSADEAVEVLAGLRRAALETGVGFIGSGTHPSAGDDEALATETDRYRFIAEQLGDAMVTPVAAMHVHVGMPSAEHAIRALNGLREHLPLLEALGANSPFRHDRDSGFASARALSLRAWPRSGAPRAFADYEDFAGFAERLTRAAQVPDYTFHWWKLRPHPRLGTVELRALDVPSSLASGAALVELVQAIAADAAESHVADPLPPEILAEGSNRAARDGVHAELPDADGRLVPVADLVAQTVDRLGLDGDGLGALLAAGGGAGEQRRDASEGGMPGVLAGLMERARL